MIHGVLNPDTDVREFEQALDETLDKVVSDAVTREDVMAARSNVLREISETWNDPFKAAKAVGAALAAGRSIENALAWTQQVAAVTPDRIKAAAKHVLKSSNAVCGVLRPE